MIIRDATPSDASRIAEILIFAKRAAYRSIFCDDRVSFGVMQVLPLALGLRDEPDALRGVTVLDDGFVKGMARLRPAAEPGVAELAELYVDPFFQREGAGRALLEDACDRARRLGARTLMMWVLEKNAPGRRFYERLGFAPTGARELEAGTPEYLAQYAKAL